MSNTNASFSTLPPLPSHLPNSLSRAEWLSLLRADQQRRWRHGERVMVEEYLTRWPTLGDDAEGLLDLVYGEVLLREEGGESVTVDEYLRRFPAHEASLKRQFDLHRALATGAFPTSESGGTRAASPVSQGQSETATVPPTLIPEATSQNGVSPPTQAGISRREQPALATVPGYEILGTLGKGGMGIVYQARRLALNRVVALKMILAGAHAGTEERQRFRREAEAVARLQHPGIVQIYEVGEHEGLPYLSLEYCPGGSLEKRLAGTPLPPREAAQLVERLARAVQAAHEKRVVHRDLKPANVLLAEDGTPKVTDFGLAKRLDEASRTNSGAIMGTPSYMAPEQAGGKMKEVGPATDVYALGTILYECLTGRPPFKAATALETMQQVVGDEPAPLRQLQSKTPADLETVCLKCLRKELGQRYGSAAELAEDLRRFLAGEPVQARPVGTWERGIKWVRRRPAVAALLAFCALALVAGTVVSTYFAFQADQRAKEADESATEAHTREKEANEAREQAETILARSLLRPLGHQVGSVNDVELDALWELAESPSDRVRLLFVANALETEGKARQLGNREELALHAAVGLDRQRRQRVKEMMLSRLQDEPAGFALRIEIAQGAATASPGPELAAMVARLLSEALANETNPYTRVSLAKGLSKVATRLGPGEAARYAAAAARLLSEALAYETDPFSRLSLAQGLTAVVARLGPGEAAAVARLLSEALAKETNPRARYSLAQGLSAVAARLGPEEAARLLSEALAKETNPDARQSLARGLVTMSVRLGPEEAVRRSLLAARAVAESPLPHPLAGLPALALAAQPLPSRLSIQELVELLKMPTCVGDARAVILQQLGGRYNRDFADQWEFVEYAAKHLPDVDLKSPPKRPGK
jgi:hypothetical protein